MFKKYLPWLQAYGMVNALCAPHVEMLTAILI